MHIMYTNNKNNTYVCLLYMNVILIITKTSHKDGSKDHDTDSVFKILLTRRHPTSFHH